MERAKEASQRSTLLGAKSVEQRQRLLGNYHLLFVVSLLSLCRLVVVTSISISHIDTICINHRLLLLLPDAPSIHDTFVVCRYHCILRCLTLLLYLFHSSLLNRNIVLLTDANDKLLRQNDMIANAQRTVAETEEVQLLSNPCLTLALPASNRTLTLILI